MNFQNIPQKNAYYFKEITSLTGVKPYVLRFWESEFSQIAPTKNEGGQKVYSQADLTCVKMIKDLLFEDKLSIAQAKMYLDKESSNQKKSMPVIKEEPREQLVTQKNQGPEEAEGSAYRSVETRESIESILAKRSSSLKGFQESLKQDLEARKETIIQKQFNDQDVLRLVQAKKKLTSTLSKINSIIETNHWG